MNQTIRIIGGLYRGKKLHFPAIEGLRPTSDRIKETIFNWMMHDIQGARCLDAFAGSGALGFEAFSRGASQVIMIEEAPIAFNNLKKITTSFNSPKLTVIKDDAIHFLKQRAKQRKEAFDIVFIDPPFAKPELLSCIEIFSTTTLLANNGLLYLETPKEITLDETVWEKVRQKYAGQVCYALYKKIKAPASQFP